MLAPVLRRLLLSYEWYKEIIKVGVLTYLTIKLIYYNKYLFSKDLIEGYSGVRI